MLNRVVVPQVLKWEPVCVWLLGTLTFVSTAIYLGDLGLSWDALNHHIYLGWVAEQPRFDRDFVAAAYQSYQYPYLYWPLYKLAVAGVSGVTAGVLLATLQGLAVPPIWRLALWCCPGNRLGDVLMRFLGVVLAFLGTLTLSLLDSTSNDLLAAIPFLWAVAFAVPTFATHSERPSAQLLRISISGFAAGISVACKLSNGPIAMALPFLWMIGRDGVSRAVYRVLIASAAAGLGFILTYGYWGWQLWQHFGNPIYPFYHGAFEWLRQALEWRP